MHRKIRFAVVGLGHIGKRHCQMILDNPNCELVDICDIDSSKGAELVIKGNFYESIEKLLSNGKTTDIVSICTPNGLHAKHSIQVLEAQKHVLVEKPMALTKLDCEAVIFMALQQSKQVFCVMQNRYSPPANWLKNIVDNDVLGKIFLVEINCYWNRDDRYYLPDNKKHLWHGDKELDGGTLFTQFSHFIDLMYWVFGDIKNVKTRLADFNHEYSTDFEDTGVVHFDFLKGGLGSLTYSTAVFDKNMESTITVIGEKGTIKLGGQYMNEILYCHVKDYDMPKLEPSQPANDYGSYKGSAANHHFVIENVVDVLKGNKSMTTNASQI